MTSTAEYRGTTRTLSVLRALNQQNGATISELNKMTSISRAALYRMVGALEEAGYVRRRSEDGSIFLTSLVQTLAQGFTDESWIVETAGPVLDELQQQVVWPTDLGLMRSYSMRLAVTTRRHSPLVIDPGLVDTPLPLLRTALGLAYLAFAKPVERDLLLDHLATLTDSPDIELARDRKMIARILRDVRSLGYASRHGNVVAGRRYADIFAQNATIAVPIRIGSHSVASMGITFIASALTVREAVDRYKTSLINAAHAIEKKLAEGPGQLKSGE